MAIVFGVGSWSGLTSRHLVDAPPSALRAPSVAAGLSHLDDLAALTVLRSYRGDEWPRWFAATGATCPPLTGPVFDSSVALAEAAAGGAGVALLPFAMMTRALADRRLARPFDQTVTTEGYFLTWPSSAHPAWRWPAS